MSYTPRTMKIPNLTRPVRKPNKGWIKYQEIKARHSKLASEWQARLADITDIEPGLETWLYYEWPLLLFKRRRYRIEKIS